MLLTSPVSVCRDDLGHCAIKHDDGTSVKQPPEVTWEEQREVRGSFTDQSLQPICW